MFIEDSHKSTKGMDVQLVLYYVALVVIGWITIYSSEYLPSDSQPFFNFQNRYAKQLLFIGLSFVSIIIVLMFDIRQYMYFAYYIYLFSLLLMISVLFLGEEVSGAKAWIDFGPFKLQPTEFAKLATALALAKFFNEGKTVSERKNIWILAFVFIMLPIFIIILQKDTGSALIFFSFIILFYREGLTGWILLLGALAIGLFIFTLYFNELYSIALLTVILLLFWFINRKDRKKIVRNIIIYVGCILFVFFVNIAYNHIFQPHQKMRIDTLLGKVSDPKGADFNVNQSMIAIGSGRFFGKGYLNGTQTKLKYVPEQSTDFIFCGIGEEWGFFGSSIICALFILLIIRILYLSERQRNPFVRYYGYGIAGIIFFHFSINIGMTIGLLPIIGIPLPFISYGGSSFLAFTIMLFIFIRINDN